MSEPINDGGAAFPIPVDAEGHLAHPGMSLRDYFAAQALAGVELTLGDFRPYPGARIDMDKAALQDAAQQIAIGVYAIADAMLAERAKGTP